MIKMEAFTSVAKMNNAVKGITKDNCAFVLGRAFVTANAFAAEGNTDPFRNLYLAIPQLAYRPRGLTQTALRKALVDRGLKFNKDKKSFSIPAGLNFEPLPGNFFEKDAKVDERTDLQKFQDALTRVAKTARKLDISEEKLADMLVNAVKEAGKSE